MATTTPSFGWPVPTSTDLVKDGATAIESLGDAIDSSMADLKGGTSGQVLKKNSNTDMDFVWGTDASGMTNPMTTTGDTIYSSSGSTPARLAIGSTGQVLTVSGGIPSWASAPAAGKILQVVQGTTTTETTIASTTMTDTTITASITPTASTSKILVMISYSCGMYEAAGGAFSVGGKILRGATTIYDRITGGIGYVDHTPSNPSYKIYGGVGFSGALVYLDSPATTSSTTYKLQSNISATAGGGRGVTYQGNSAVGSIVLMEVGA